ncbi:MAG: hypothetical protein LBK02_09520, partial [Treponema sp.]|nr:hypothetical protein [Treponema sp.]
MTRNESPAFSNRFLMKNFYPYGERPSGARLVSAKKMPLSFPSGFGPGKGIKALLVFCDPSDRPLETALFRNAALINKDLRFRGIQGHNTTRNPMLLFLLLGLLLFRLATA